MVAMVDPDAPSAADPTYREVRHFLVGNVIGSELRNNGTDWYVSTLRHDVAERERGGSRDRERATTAPTGLSRPRVVRYRAEREREGGAKTERER